MDLLEMMEIVEREEKMGRVEREDDWRRNTPIPEQSILHFATTPIAPLHPHLFGNHHVQNGCHTPAYQAHPSRLVDPRSRNMSTRRRPNTPRGWCGPYSCRSSSPARSSIVVRLRTSRTSTSRSNSNTSSSSSSTARTRPKTRRRKQGVCTATIPSSCSYCPPLSVQYQPAALVARPYMVPGLAPPSYVSASPYTPQPSPVPSVWYGVFAIGNADTPAPDANANTIEHGYFRSPSFAALAPPTLTLSSNCHDPQ